MKILSYTIPVLCFTSFLLELCVLLLLCPFEVSLSVSLGQDVQDVLVLVVGDNFEAVSSCGEDPGWQAVMSALLTHFPLHLKIFHYSDWLLLTGGYLSDWTLSGFKSSGRM